MNCLDAETGELVPRGVGSGLLEARHCFSSWPHRMHMQLLGSKKKETEAPGRK